MFFMLGHSFKRLIREGLKSLSVPFIAFVLVVLINLLGGIKTWLEDRYEDTLDNFPIVAVVSDLYVTNTDDLRIGLSYIDIFTDPDVNFSLAEHTGELSLKRTMTDFHIQGSMTEIALIGITNKRTDSSLDPEYGAEITFFEGYDEGLFLSDDRVCIISEDLIGYMVDDNIILTSEVKLPDEFVQEPVFPELEKDQEIVIHYISSGSERIALYYIRYPYLGTFVEEQFEPEFITTLVEGKIVKTEVEFLVVGTVSGTGPGLIFSPFWNVSEFAAEFEESFVISESLSIILSDNRELSAFKATAAMSFSRANPVQGTRPFAMVVYDSEFFETLEPLRQNIIVVDVATPFIYLLSIAIGFLTSVLLTRRRKAEFAIMRSIGVNSRIVFTNALTEQILLSVTGVALGFVFVSLVWDYSSLTRPAVFLACYLLGAVFAAFGAAGTNVMKVLRDRGE